MQMSIEQLQDTVAFLHTGFIVCIVLASVFLVLTVLLFFNFKVLAMLKQRTGIEARKAISELDFENKKTDALKHDCIALGEKTPGVLRGRSGKVGGGRSKKLAPQQVNADTTTVLGDHFVDAEPTAVLGNQATDANPTTVLGDQAIDANPTTVLSGMQRTHQNDSSLCEQVRPSHMDLGLPSGFKITKNILIIHTTDTELM
jgi:hypothetical protein